MIRRALILFVAGICTGSTHAQVQPAAAALPTDPGMYLQSGGDFTKIIGQIAQFTRTGSRLVSHATVGIKAAKANIQLPGPHAQTVVSPQPVFYFIPPKQAAAAGVNAGDFILIRLEEKPQRRQFEIAAAGLFRASSGISLTHQIQILRSEPQPGIYVITPATELDRGEYALYLARGEGMAAYVYDFGVQGTSSALTFQKGIQHRAIESPSRAATDDGSLTGPSVSAATATINSQTNTPANGVSARASATTPVSGQIAVPKSQGGVLGVIGTNWQQGGMYGVEIEAISENSSAQLAGLRKGHVITNVDGAKISSTQDLANALSRLEPGSRVTIGYQFKSNLGWMPKETVVVLSK